MAVFEKVKLQNILTMAVFPNLFYPRTISRFMLCLRTTYISYARWRRSKNFPTFYDVI